VSLLLRAVTKQLVCPACGVVVADVRHRTWPVVFVLVSPDGAQLQPATGLVLLRQVQAQAGGEDRADFVRRHLGELLYDLRCRNGHSTLRTLPQLVRAVRRARGRWVDLQLP
jgi:hypothetical protein